MTSNQLSECIAQVTHSLKSALADVLPLDETNYLAKQVPVEVLHNIIDIKSIINSFEFNYEIDEHGDDEHSKKVVSFNADLRDKLSDVIISSSFTQIIIDTLSTHLAESKKFDKSEVLNFNGFTFNQAELAFFNKISILLDFLIHLVTNEFIHVKHVFYDSVLKLSKLLSEISTYEVEKFWYYMESRESLIADKIFNNSVIADRISFLEICNKLTDIQTGSSIKDMNKKDTYNDRFQYRVRVFLSNIFLFEDNTGLNKYFHVSNKVTLDFKQVKSPFIDDILYIHRVFNDPYLYLKRTSSLELKSLVSGIQHVYEYLLKEEVASHKRVKWDNFLVVPEKSQSEKSYLADKYSGKLYFPENYLISGFADSKVLSEEDTKFLNGQFNDSKVRLQYLTMIYIISHLYVELTLGEKQDFLKSLGSTSSLKHLTDGVLPDMHKKFFVSVKSEILKTLRTVDPSFAALLSHLAVTERIWWGWLIYGKDPKTNKTLFFNKLLPQEELIEAKEKFALVLPFKSKKYFNTFITPQLTRKMRTKTGLSTVEVDTEMHDHDSKIDEMNEKIENGKFEESDVEERNSWIWKKLKSARSGNWLGIGSLISAEMLSEPIKEDVPEEVAQDEQTQEIEMKDVEGEIKDSESKETGSSEANETEENGLKETEVTGSQIEHIDLTRVKEMEDNKLKNTNLPEAASEAEQKPEESMEVANAAEPDVTAKDSVAVQSPASSAQSDSTTQSSSEQIPEPSSTKKRELSPSEDGPEPKKTKL